MLAVLTVVFFLMHASGDPAITMLGQDATEEQIENFRRAYGLDQPIMVQYGQFLIHAIRLDFGVSILQARPAIEAVLDYFPNTLKLAGVAIIIGLAVGIPIGIIAGVRRNSPFDYLLMGTAVIGQSAPGFWLGIMLILVFAVTLGWLPTSGTAAGTEGIRYLVLPALTLCPWFLTLIARLTRSGILEVMRQDYIRTAYAKGLSKLTVIRRHALKNAAIPLVTMTGLNLAHMMGGALIAETIFAWPGVGWLAYRSVLTRDYPVTLAIVALVAIAFVTINILVDIIIASIDPRIRLGRGEG